MPTLSPKPCKHNGCRVLVRAGAYCEAHAKKQSALNEAVRESSTQRGYGYRWQKVSKAYLRKHPLCECPDCLAGEKRLKAATVVDHIIPHKGDMKLFWDNNNWQAMAKDCHDSKTAREDGGFGLPPGGHQKSGGFSF